MMNDMPQTLLNVWLSVSNHYGNIYFQTQVD